MDTGLTLKAAAAAQVTDLRPDPAARSAVATELAPAKAVTATSNTAQTPVDDARTREIVLDPHSREVIYRAVDVRARRVVRRLPEEALLRLRAYARAMREEKDGENAFDATA
jgi:hypothetical protein